MAKKKILEAMAFGDSVSPNSEAFEMMAKWLAVAALLGVAVAIPSIESLADMAKQRRGSDVSAKSVESMRFLSRGSMDQIFEVKDIIPNESTIHLNISLEKLFDKYHNTKLTPQPDVREIDDVHVMPPNVSNAKADAEFYGSAADLLRRVAPNLRTVSFAGAYMFKPANENNPAAIKDEILFIRSFLKMLIRTFTSRGVSVKTIRFVVGIIVPEKTQKQVDFARIIQASFGYQPNHDELEVHTVGMQLSMDGTAAFIGIGMNPLRQEQGWMTPTSIIPTGRTPFLEQVLLTGFKKEWYSKVLDMVQPEPSTTAKARHRVNELSRKFFFNTALDDPTIRAVGRTNELPRRLFDFQPEMDFLAFAEAPRLQLEDFFDKHIDTVLVETAVEKLGLRVTVQNRTGIPLSRVYATAVQNLRKLAPNLRVVSLQGGYSFQPERPTAESVRREMEFLSENIRTWIVAFAEQNIAVADIRFIVNIVVPSKIRDSMKYDQIFRSVFGYTPTPVEKEHNAVRMQLEAGQPKSVPIRLGIHFTDILTLETEEFCAQRSLNERNPQFHYSCAEKRNSQNWYRSVWADEKFSWN